MTTTEQLVLPLTCFFFVPQNRIKFIFDILPISGASLNLTDFCKKFGGAAPPPALGAPRDYNIDLIPKSVICSVVIHFLFVLLAAFFHLALHLYSTRGSSRSSRYIMADGDLIKMLVKADVNKCVVNSTNDVDINCGQVKFK
jgi:hypothetical protein